MNITFEKIDDVNGKIVAQVEEADYASKVDAELRKIGNTHNIPGFRKGKAPRKLIENLYGDGVFFEDALNICYPDAFEKAVAEAAINPVAQADVEIQDMGDTGAVTLLCKVPVEPEVTLGQYKGLEAERAEVSVTAEDVNAELDRIAQRFARTETVEREAKDGDTVMIDFEGFLDGVAFEGGKGEDYPLTIGSGAFIPGFEEQLVGAEIGKEVEVKVTFPEDYQAENLQGKEAVFKCTIKEIKEKELPELDDEFASEVSEFETMAEYRESVKKNLTEKKEKDAKNAKEEAAIQAVVEDSEMEIPEPMLESQQKQMVDEFAQRITMQGLSMEQYFQFTGTKYQKMVEQVKPQALERIKSRLVLEAVVKAENIEVTEEDYEKELETMAQVYQMEIAKVKDLMGEREKKNIMQDLAVRKAAEFITDNAKESKAK